LDAGRKNEKEKGEGKKNRGVQKPNSNQRPMLNTIHQNQVITRCGGGKRPDTRGASLTASKGHRYTQDLDGGMG